MRKNEVNAIRTEEELANMSSAEITKLKKESAQAVSKAIVVDHARVMSVSFKLLNVPSHQRRLDIKRAAIIASAWDNSNCQIISVAYYDGLLWIIDGMHRVNAAIMAHIHNPEIKKPITSLCCQLFVEKSREECCLIFVYQNEKKSLKPYDRYKALLLSGNKRNKGAIAAQLVFDIITRKYGIMIQDNEQRGCLSAVQAPFVMAQRRPDAKEALDWIFSVLVNSDFYHQESGMAADIIRGMEDIYDTFKDYHLGVATKVCINIFEDNTYKTLLSKYAKYYQGIDKRTAIKHYFKKCIGEQMLKDGITPPPTVIQAIDLSKAGVVPAKPTTKKAKKNAPKKGTTSKNK